jgi:hypothetical protein
MPEFTNDITITILDENTINIDVVEQVLSITSESVGPPGGNIPGQMLQDYSIKAQVAEVGDEGYVANLDNGNSFQLTLVGNTNVQNITGWPGVGEEGKATFYIEQGSGPFTFKWPPRVKWVNAAQGVISPTPGDWDVFVLTSLDAGSTIFGFHVGRT